MYGEWMWGDRKKVPLLLKIKSYVSVEMFAAHDKVSCKIFLGSYFYKNVQWYKRI